MRSLVTVETTMHLQRLADRALVTATRECRAARMPLYDSYIHLESLRRTLFLACVFDDIFCTDNGFPTIVAANLGEAMAPGPRRLWRCAKEDFGEEWQLHCRRWERSEVSVWPSLHGPGLSLRELWGFTPQPPDPQRYDRWLVEADEFGLWIMTVCEMVGNGRYKDLDSGQSSL